MWVTCLIPKTLPIPLSRFATLCGGSCADAVALVTGAELGHDLTRFRPSRFADGSAMRLGPSV